MEIGTQITELIPPGTIKTVDAIPTTSYKSVKWLIHINENTANKDFACEILALYTHSGVRHSAYSITGDKIDCIINVLYVNGNITLQISNDSPNQFTVNLTRI